MDSFAAQLVHDVSNWTSSVMNSFMSRNSNNTNNDESENKDNKEHASKPDSKIISDIMFGAMGENIFKRLMHPDHRDAAKLWSQLCHKIDISYPPKQLLKRIDTEHKSNIELMNEIRYSMRHSFTAYQPAIVAMKSQEISLALKTQKQLLKTCFNIADDDIIVDNCSLKMDNWMGKTHEPSFYLIVDHNKHKIVLSIRGTSSIADVITDLNASAKPCHNNIFGVTGCVHEGMLESAYFIRNKISLQLINLCELYTNYAVIITGHSLGAGVASLLGLMYKDHPIIYKKNGLKVYSFASPCIVSKEFVESNVATDYITSIALSTDVVTRLSWESMRKCNLRQDFIMKHSKEMINECLRCEYIEGESAAAEFLRVLKCLKSERADKELYPLGTVLWFVPNVVMNDDVVYRRNCLMNLKNMPVECVDNNEDWDMELKENDNGKDNLKTQKSKLNEIFSSTWDNMTNGVMDFKQSVMDLDTFNGRTDSSASDMFKEFYHDLSKGINNIKNDIGNKLDKSKRNKKNTGGNYVLCDASACKYIFQELVFDLPESVNAHEPQRYLWACDSTLRVQ